METVVDFVSVVTPIAILAVYIMVFIDARMQRQRYIEAFKHRIRR